MSKRINKETIFKAARELQEKDEKVTTLTLHKHLGHGSYTTISKYLKAWEAEGEAQEDAAQVPAVIDTPDAIAQEGNRLVSKIWTTARQMSLDELEVQRAALDAKAATLQEETAQAIDMADATAAENERLRDRIEHLEKELAAGANAAKAEADRTNATIDRHVQTISRLEASLETATAETTKLRADLDARMAETIKDRSTMAKLSADKEHLERELTTARESSATRIRELTADLEASRAEVASRFARIDKLEDELAGERAEVETRNATIDSLERKQKETAEALAEAAREKAALEDRLKKAEEALAKAAPKKAPAKRKAAPKKSS